MAEYQKLSEQGKVAEAAKVLQQLGSQTHDPQVSTENHKVQLERLFTYKDVSEGVGALIEEYVSLGIHPFDEVGRKPYKNEPWYKAFDMTGEVVSYASSLDDTAQQQLGVAIREELMELVDDVIFANTFFALEETGLAYPSISRDAGEAVDRLDAWLRVFASATRVQENKFFNDAKVTEWDTAQKVPVTNRVRKFADALHGPAALPELDNVLDAFTKHGHVNGIVRVGKVFLRIAQSGEDR